MKPNNDLDEVIRNAVGTERVDLMNRHILKLVQASSEPGEYQQKLELCLELAVTNLSDAQAMSYSRGEAVSSMRLSRIYHLLGKHVEAFTSVRNAERLFQETGDREGYSNALVARGLLHSKFSQHDEAIKAQLEAREIKQALGDRHAVGCTLNNIGLVYSHLGKFEQALEMYTQAAGYYDIENYPNSMVNLHNNMGIALAMVNRFDEAIAHFTLSYKGREDAGDYPGMAQSLNNIGRFYTDCERPKEAIETLGRSLEIFELLHDEWNTINCRANIARAWIQLGDLARADEELARVREYLVRNEGSDIELHYWEEMTNFHRFNHDFEQALEAYKKFIEVRDRFAGQETERRIREMQMHHELMSREREIESERVRNTELERVNAELQETLDTRDRIFSIIAHDIRNPINALQLSGEYLYDHFEKHDRSTLYRLIGVMKDGSRRLNDLVENLLLWAGTRSGDIPYLPETLRLGDLVSDTLLLLEPGAQKKGIDLIGDVQQEDAFGDRNMITTILRNLVNNAIKFTLPGGRVVVLTTLADNRVEISVSDTGVGMTPEMIREIENRKSHRSSKGTAGERGNGLGLIICREFAERHGGRLTIGSELGKGSRFIFTVSDVQKNQGESSFVRDDLNLQTLDTNNTMD
jgi:signal transduction histidine kinase